MDQTQKLLQEIVENGRMGQDACEQLLTRAADAEMRRELMQEKQEYAEAVRDAETRLYALGVQPQSGSVVSRVGLWMGMQINTLADRSSSHIADMLIQGATMGVVALTKARNSYSEADAEAQGVASNLIERQQQAIDRLKCFLAEKVVN